MFAAMSVHFIFQLFFFDFFVFIGSHYYCHDYLTLVYFDLLPLNVFQCDWCPCLCCLNFSLFIPLLRQGLVPGLWILLATGVVPSSKSWVAGQQ